MHPAACRYRGDANCRSVPKLTIIALRGVGHRPKAGTMSAILWLNDLPLELAAAVLVGGSIVLSLVGTAVAYSFFGAQQLNLNNIVGGFKYLFVSGIYAGFLGFLLFGVYNRYDKLRANIVEDVSELTTLDRLATAFPPGTASQLRDGLKAYARQVVEVEWPQLRSRTANPLTATALDTLDYVYASVEPTTAKQQQVINTSRKILAKMRDQRGVRVLRSFGVMQGLLWGVTIVGSVVAIVLPWLFGSPNFGATMLMSVLSITLMTSVVLVVLKLSYPFTGSSGIPPTPYLAFIAEVPRGGR